MNQNSPDITHYKDQLKRGVKSLRFSPELERLYRQYYRSRYRIRQLIAIALGATILILFTPFDTATMPPALKQTYLWVRWGFAIPSLLLVCACHFIKPLKPYITLTSILAVLNVSLGTLYIYVQASNMQYDFSYEGIILILMITYFMAGLRFQIATGCALATFVSFVLATLFLIPPSGKATLNMFYVATTFLCGAVGAYTIEYQIRKNFLQQAIMGDMATKDGLTGLYNRGAIMERLDNLIEYARREQKYLTVYLADVDCFKQYNDYYGHIQGDCCLKQVANSLKNCCLRDLDFAGRFGGEEFLLVWFDTNPQETEALVNRVQESVLNMNIPHQQSQVADTVTVSGGFITLIPNEHTTMESLLHHADMALYSSKKKGRNRVTACATPQYA